MPALSAILASADAAASGQSFFVGLLAILGAAAVVAMFLRRFKLSVIPGYLITGAVIGPGLLRIVTDSSSIESISHLAILLLMFIVGLHLSTEAVRGGMVRVLSVGVASTLLVTAILWGPGIALGLSTRGALVVAMALSMSSTAVVLRMLQDQRDMNTVHGRIVFGTLIVQDLFAVAFLGIIPLLGTPGGMAANAAAQLSGAAGQSAIRMIAGACLAIGGIILMILAGRWILPRLFDEASKAGAEVVLVLSAAVALGSAALTAWLGFSPELGAFLGGFILASTPFKHQLSGQLAPMRDLLMAVFFTAVGLSIDFNAIGTHWWQLLLGLILLLTLKPLAIAFASWALGAPATAAARTAGALWQGGEFSLVLLGAGLTAGAISPESRSVVLALVVLSLILTPSIYNYSPRIAARLRTVAHAPWIGRSILQDDSVNLPGDHGGDGVGDPVTLNSAAAESASIARHVIIAGFGVVGRNVAEHLAAIGVRITVIELNPSTVRRQRELGKNTVYGDAANPDVLESAGLRTTDAVILTIPDDDATLRACRIIRTIAPEVFIAVRTSFLSLAIQATALGADHVTVEEVATARDMAEQILRKLRRRHEARQPTSTPMA